MPVVGSIALRNVLVAAESESRLPSSLSDLRLTSTF